MELGRCLCCCISILSYALLICIFYLTVSGPTKSTNSTDINSDLTNETLIETLNDTILFALNETIANNGFNSSSLNSTDNE
jgi:hypothetical protein